MDGRGTEDIEELDDFDLRNEFGTYTLSYGSTAYEAIAVVQIRRHKTTEQKERN